MDLSISGIFGIMDSTLTGIDHCQFVFPLLSQTFYNSKETRYIISTNFLYICAMPMIEPV